MPEFEKQHDIPNHFSELNHREQELLTQLFSIFSYNTKTSIPPIFGSMVNENPLYDKSSSEFTFFQSDQSHDTMRESHYRSIDELLTNLALTTDFDAREVLLNKQRVIQRKLQELDRLENTDPELAKRILEIEYAGYTYGSNDINLLTRKISDYLEGAGKYYQRTKLAEVSRKIHDALCKLMI